MFIGQTMAGKTEKFHHNLRENGQGPKIFPINAAFEKEWVFFLELKFQISAASKVACEGPFG